MSAISQVIQTPFAILLNWLYDFCSNYGLALIIFALIVKLVLLPLSAMSKKSMMKMSRLTPKVKALEAKFGDDKQKYQEEVNKLYKEEGVSTCGGCIWSLLPLAILIPLYAIIREPLKHMMGLDADTITTLHTAFTNALTAAKESGANDVITRFNETYWQYYVARMTPAEVVQFAGAAIEGFKQINFSFLGIDLSLIPTWKVWTITPVWSEIGGVLVPLLSGGFNWLSMFISQKMNNTVVVDKDGVQDEAMAKSANTGKYMTYMMPLMSVVFGFMFPLGLSIYWMAQAVIGIVQDYFLTKIFKKKYDEEDAIKMERAAQEAEREAERERIRAEKRAANPEGITENTSKKKIQQQKKQEKAAAEAAYLAKTEPPKPEKPDPKDETRPYRRGRAYRPDRYEDEPKE